MKIISLHKQAYETSEWNKQDSFPSPPEKPTFTDTNSIERYHENQD